MLTGSRTRGIAFVQFTIKQWQHHADLGATLYIFLRVVIALMWKQRAVLYFEKDADAVVSVVRDIMDWIDQSPAIEPQKKDSIKDIVARAVQEARLPLIYAPRSFVSSIFTCPRVMADACLAMLSKANIPKECKEHFGDYPQGKYTIYLTEEQIEWRMAVSAPKDSEDEPVIGQKVSCQDPWCVGAASQ